MDGVRDRSAEENKRQQFEYVSLVLVREADVGSRRVHILNHRENFGRHFVFHIDPHKLFGVIDVKECFGTTGGIVFF